MPLSRFFHPVLRAKRLRAEPVRVSVAGEHVALFRDANGVARALVDRCPHRFAPLSKGHVRPDGRLACPYHGWHFDGDGHGVSPTQPSLKKCDVAALQVIEAHGYLFIAQKGVSTRLPFSVTDGYDFAGAFSMPFDAPLHVTLDNFSEDEHTPFVHTRLGWDEADLYSVAFDAQNCEDRTEVRYAATQRRSPLRHLIGVRDGDRFHNDWVTHFDPVRTVYDIYWTCPRTGRERGVRTRSTIFMVPESETRTWFHVFVTVCIRQRRFRLIAPVVKRSAVALAWWEIRDDQRFVPMVADTPRSMNGMRLGKFDKPLIHNRKLLDRIYWGADADVVPLRRGKGS